MIFEISRNCFGGSRIQRICPGGGNGADPQGQQDLQFQQDTNLTSLVAANHNALKLWGYKRRKVTELQSYKAAGSEGF